ncbi:MAG: hypothetical protein HYS43_01490 [Candidatus Liptonbacteria bacterium]|nr:hypothetical protein [Candidatus Liptonbacteria bacterium]
MNELATDAFNRTRAILRRCAKPNGFYASCLPGGYEATWTRDSMLTALGAVLIDKEGFREPFWETLALLARNQSPHGQIPNAVGTYNVERRSDVTYNTIDSNLWYLIGHYVYKRTYGSEMADRHADHIARAMTWLEYQDPNEDGLLVQQPTMDWQDAFPHKYGRTISTQALWYAVLMMYGKQAQAERIRRVVNGAQEEYLSLYDAKRGYYLPWIWKSHDGVREQGEWFDSFGNVMAIVTGLADGQIAHSIAAHVRKKKIDKPYPLKAIFPALKPGGKDWHPYFAQSDARAPYRYLNAGVWPFIGGLYVAALVRMGEHAEAEAALDALAHANKRGTEKEWEFNEWLDGRTGAPSGTPEQGWSAGAYIFAYESARLRTVPFFL